MERKQERTVRAGYHSASETERECPHKVKKHTENGYEWISTWLKYNPEKYAGRIERCYLCKQKRVLDLTGENVAYIEQASLFG